ncbi:MAG: hypothetical protein IPP10_12810 [Candidatus Competibacteraceae bacterium]|nr:hypothetical protein [Candidatus Competibacteraceae bacterium]MBK8899374.1 hypothetical protein [Candidatus Competibacteraceae bacterium]MBK9952366.1 hypothetical protein [Candidatus Competibacteraceae bacterium]
MNQHTQRSIPLLLALLALTAALTVYARCVLGYPICGTDEQNYLKIFDWLDGGGSWPISGPGYAGLIFELRDWTGLATRPLVAAVASLNSAFVLPLGLWLFYRASLNDIRSAWWCLAFLFAGSYFLGPWLEGRPQQLGMLLAAAGAGLAYRDLRERGTCGPAFFLVWVLCFGYHILSFVVLTVLVFGFWARRFIQNHSDYGALAALLLGLALCLALGGLWYPLVWLDIRSNHILGAHAFVFFGQMMLAAAGILLSLHGLRAYQIGQRLVGGLRAGLALPLLPWLTAGLVGLALFWQYAWLGPIYRTVNPFQLIWYQGGNILLAVLFLTGFWRLIQKPVSNMDFFMEACLILMALGTLFLLLTPWLRDHNWTLRIITYWTWYAAPIAVLGWQGLPAGWRRSVLLLCVPLLVGGLHHTLYAPTWTCQLNG